MDGLLDMSLILNKIFDLMLLVPSGIWIGYEGPLVQICSGIMSFVLNHFSEFHNEAVSREIVSSGVSIGIGLAFNAPIGGVMYGLEQIQSYYQMDKLMWNAFVCSTIGVAILESFHPFKALDTNNSFQVDLKNNWLFIEFFPYVFLGMLCGVMGILFNKLNLRFAQHRQMKIGDNKKLQLVEILVIIIVTILLSYPFGVTRSTLLEMLDVLFTDCADDSKNPLCTIVPQEPSEFPFELFFTLSFTAVQGFILTAYTYGCAIPGGVLIPTLAIGGLTGRLIGSILEYYQNVSSGGALFATCFNEKKQCISPASYAVVGAASFLASVTRMNLTAVVIMFELTGALTYIIPIMLGVFFARFVNDLVLSSSIYESWMKFNYPSSYLPAHLEDTLRHSELSIVNADRLMVDRSHLSVLYESDGITLGDLDMLDTTDEDGNRAKYGFPILQSQETPVLVGHIAESDVRHVLDVIKLEGVIPMTTKVQFTVGFE
ncbi:unnamed protein product [Ambrosiozyma monospora]|uniref:Unnamed protein product n=1 Tax=Ambrosiozyma monospora TaxID=43982 RepID=A0ACB5TUL4_AMBMO|nr:unnamed protein product [Ambrosiozyma monospora]